MGSVTVEFSFEHDFASVAPSSITIETFSGATGPTGPTGPTGADGLLEARLKSWGNLNVPTLDLDFDLYEGHFGRLTEDLTLTISNPKYKIVTVDLIGIYAITYPANATVIGDTYDGAIMNTLTIHYISAVEILIIVTNWV